ncbi:MAG: lysylphosphatidylglycerol synthase transmembrane domain-containing protein [Acidobacteriota bacterium]
MNRMSEAQDDNQTLEKKRGLNWRGVIQVCIGIGALALLIYKSDTHALLEAIKTTRISYLPFAVLMTILVNWLMAYRWGVILNVRGQKIKTHRLFLYYLIGIFFTNFVPGGGISGDVARLIYADREVRDKPFVLSTLIYERLVALFVLLSLGFFATLASRNDLPEGRAFYLGEAVLAVAFLASASLMSEFLSSRLAKLAQWIGRKVGLERLGLAVARTLEAASELRKHKKMLLMTVLLSILIRVAWGLGCFIVAQAMNLPVSFPILFSFISLIDIVRMLPTWGGGIGVREWALVALFANLGIAREQALMFSFLAFAPVMLNAFVGGIIYTSSAGILKKELQGGTVPTKQVEV